MATDDLHAAIDTLAASLEGVERRALGETTEYTRAGRRFAALTPSALEVDLDEAVTRAALRTPDVAPSAGRRGWIAFAPAALDRYALDRAIAWFEAAWRRAGGRARLS